MRNLQPPQHDPFLEVIENSKKRVIALFTLICLVLAIGTIIVLETAEMVKVVQALQSTHVVLPASPRAARKLNAGNNHRRSQEGGLHAQPQRTRR